MASEEWLKKRYKMEAMVQHMSSNIAAHPPGELPPYVPPDKPSSPWEPGKSPAPSRQKLASTQIRPNQIMLPFVPKEPETDDMYGEGVDEVELKGLQAQGPDYAADKLKYGKFDKILDPSGTQKIKPTLEQLREHKSKYQA